MIQRDWIMRELKRKETGQSLATRRLVAKGRFAPQEIGKGSGQCQGQTNHPNSNIFLRRARHNCVLAPALIQR